MSEHDCPRWMAPSCPPLSGPECGWGSCPTTRNSSANQNIHSLGQSQGTLPGPSRGPRLPSLFADQHAWIPFMTSWLSEVTAFSLIYQEIWLSSLNPASGPGTHRSLRLWSRTLPLPLPCSQAGAPWPLHPGWKEVRQLAGRGGGAPEQAGKTLWVWCMGLVSKGAEGFSRQRWREGIQ